MKEKSIPNGKKRAPCSVQPAKRKPAKAPAKAEAALQAFIVSGEGTDEEIAARCAKDIPDWVGKSDRARAETVRLMRLFWNMPAAPLLEINHDSKGNSTIGAPADSNVTLVSLRLIEALASSSQDYGNEKVEEIARYLRQAKHGDPTSQELNAALAFVHGAAPTDTVQSSLAIQMYATHKAAMKALGRMETAEYVDQMQLFGTLGTKLLNAYTRQAETLAKLQRGGEQVIKHIHIDNRGGQAVVTDQVVTGGRNEKVGDQPYGTGNAAQCPALPCPNPQGNDVPVACDKGQEAVQAAWGTFSGRA